MRKHAKVVKYVPVEFLLIQLFLFALSLGYQYLYVLVYVACLKESHLIGNIFIVGNI